MARGAEDAAFAAPPSFTGGPVNPGSMPRMRVLATLPELKVMMPQGVAENPSFQTYIIRGGLQAYEDQISELAGGFTKSATGDRRSTDGGEGNAEAKADRSKSFSLHLLMHRWDRECKPRIAACLVKRVALLHIDMVDALMQGLWLPNEEMGTKLMDLREG